MYRARLQSVAGRLWNEALIRPLLQGSASLLPLALRQANASRSSCAFLLAASVIVPLAVSAPETITTHCDDAETESRSENDVPLAPTASDAEAIAHATESNDPENENCSGNDAADAPQDNPLWPSGVSVDMVNAYVDEILANPDINIKSVPDSMERIIYVSTVRLTLDTVYQCVSWLHGTEVLGHRFILDRRAADTAAGIELRLNTGKKLNYDILGAMADELLENKAINQRWLPDIIERQVYVNCMRIMFTIIDGVADTMAFRLCGHQLNLSFEPIDEERARELVRRHSEGIVIDEPALDALIDEAVRESHEASPVTEAISYLPGYQSFLRTLHKTLYSLILGVLADVLSKTEIVILEDSIRIQLVPERVYASRFVTEQVQVTDNQEKMKSMEKELGEVKSREARTRSTASVLVVSSMVASIAAILLSRRSS